MLRLFTKSRFTFAAALLSLVAANQVLAQGKTLTRRYEPIVVTAGKLSALKDDTIKVFTAYCYVNDEFRPSPFQIDEVTKKGEYLIEKDEVADSNDEVVFMPQGTGNQAPTNKWVEGSDDVRLELEVTDPITQDKGWLYLFQHVKNPAVAPSHVRYGPAPPNAAGADTVTGESYIEAHEKDTGWFTDISIKAPVGDGKDILDRQKVRIKARFAIFTITLKEDTLQFVNVSFEQRPVRSFREISYIVDLFGTKIPFTFNTQYFPYSTLFGAKNVTLPVFSGLTYIEVRLSADFNEQAKGMRFFNAYNAGILVDGVQDSYNKTITSPPNGLNWFMLTGNPGTYLTLIDVPRLGTNREFYYKDNLATDINDSGDKKSYGDSGLLISSPAAGDTLSINFTTYYLDNKDQTATFGEGFKERALKPLQVAAVEQKRMTTAVNEDRPLPAGFALHDAQPNPFAPQFGQVRISFGLGATNISPRLRIFNMLGQEVARFAGVDLRRNNAVLWDGRDQLGRAVPAGVYFYQLEAGRQRAVKKLVLVR